MAFGLPKMRCMTELDYTLFLKAMLVGLSIAAPVGPIGLLTIQRTLQGGWASGLATGLGAAVADALYGAVGALGVTWLIELLTSARLPLALGGGALLMWLAWQTWRAPLAESAAQSGGTGLWGQFAGTVVLTLSNPATILSFVAIFGALSGTLGPADGVVASTSVDAVAPATASPLPMVAGVFAGSALWWLVLATVVAGTRHRFQPQWRRRINLVSALFLAGFALWQVWGACLHL